MTEHPERNPASIPDQELTARILAGEKQLFEQLMRRYNQRLYRIGMSILGSDAEVQDAMQTAYISAFEHLPGFEGRSSLGTWLTRIMLNQCLGQKRKAGQLAPGILPDDKFVNMNTPAKMLINKELSDVLEEAIAQLPEKYRLVFVLREIEEVSVRDTADALSIEETNVKVRLNRAKTMLRQHLSGYMKDHVYGFHLSKCDAVVNYVLQHLGIDR